MKIKDFEKLTVSLLDEGVLHIHIKESANIELNDAVKAVEAMGILGGGKKYPVLIDAEDYSSVDNEVRTFSASEESNLFTIADAIAYYSLAQKLMSSFYIQHDKPFVPTKAFPNKEEAIKWLKTFVKH